MPFTPAHPAAVLPLHRRPFVTSALWLDPLIGLVLLAIYNVVVKRPLLALAPTGLAARLPAPRGERPWLGLALWTVVSVVIGAFTHVVWDSFTHGDGYFVQRFPGLFRAEIAAGWDVNRVLQYVSTVGGCVVLAGWLYRWYRRTSAHPVTPGDQMPAWVRYVVLAGVAVFGAIGAAVQIGRIDGDFAGETVVRLLLVGLAAGGLAALGWYSSSGMRSACGGRWSRCDATDGTA